MLDLTDVWTEYRETGSPEIRERIIMDCMPLVRYVVGKVAALAPPHFDREELTQSGIFGLIDAVERYDPAKDTRFETYAILRIRSAVIDELRSRDWVPRAKRKMAREVEAKTLELKSRDGTVPTIGDLAAAMGVSRKSMEETLKDTSFVSFVSLDSAGEDTGDESGERRSLADLLRDTNGREPSARLELEERVRALSRAITTLPEQERIVITLYYYENTRLRDIGKLFGVSESRISQIHGRALILLKLQMEQLLAR